MQNGARDKARPALTRTSTEFFTIGNEPTIADYTEYMAGEGASWRFSVACRRPRKSHMLNAILW